MVEEASHVGAPNDEDPEPKASVRVQIPRAGELELECCAHDELQQRRGLKEGEDEKLVA